MAVFYLRDINKTNFIEKVKKLKHEIQKSEMPKNGIIFDMRELGNQPFITLKILFLQIQANIIQKITLLEIF